MADRPDVPARLREAAASHRPDRERMLARVTAGMDALEPAAARRSLAPRSGASAGVVAALAAGGIAVCWAAAGLPARGVGDGPGVQPPPAGHTTAASDSSSPASTPPAPHHPPRPPRNEPSDERGHRTGTGTTTPPAVSTSPTGRPREGALRVEAAVDPGSNASWGRSNVTLRVARRLSGLTVELRLARTEGLRHENAWHTLPLGDVTGTVEETSEGLVYRWRLREGASLPRGTYQFAAEYRHPEGRRDASGDRYRVTAEGPEGRVHRDGAVR